MASDFLELGARTKAKIRHIQQQSRGVIVAVSGGLDSTALFHVLWRFSKLEKNFRLAALHVNFGLRGGDSDADQTFCEQLAADFGVELHVRAVTAAEREARSGESVQEWARRLRQAEFARFTKERWTVALAHHLDDAAENVLLRLARGAAPGHLLGMGEWDPPFWRPLLLEKKSALRAYLLREGLAHRDDASNAKLVYSRNVIRHKVLPELEALYPGAAERIVACAQEAQDLVRHKAPKTEAEPNALALQRQPRGVARQALAALISRVSPRHRQLSRRFLDNVLERAGLAQTLPGGGGRIGVLDGRVVVAPETYGPKEVRAAQHERALSGPPRTALLEPGSYGLFRRGRGIFALGRDFPKGGEPLWPVHVKVYGAGAGKTVRFGGSKHSQKLKELLRGWGVALDERPAHLLVEKDGQVAGLWDGSRLVIPGPRGEKTECSQSGLDLRYFSEKDL